MVVAPTITDARTIRGHNIEARVQAMMQALAPPSWFSQYGNVHQQLGIDLRQHLGSATRLRTVELEAARNIPRPFNPSFQGFTAGELADDVIRSQALREYRAVMENLARSMQTKFDMARIDRITMEEFSKRMVEDPQLRQKIIDDTTQKENQRLRQTIKVEIMQRELNTFKEAAGQSNSMSAQKSLENAKLEYMNVARLVNNGVMARLFRFMNRGVWASRLSFMHPKGSAPLPGAATIGEIGKLDINNLNAKQFLEELRQGRVAMTRMTTLLVSFIFVASVIKTIAIYKENPNVGEDAVRMFLRPAIYTSGIAYFMGANAAHYGSLEALRLSVLGLDKLFKLKGTMKYETWRAQFKVQMAAMSYIGLAGGLIAVPVAIKWVDKLTSCYTWLNPFLDKRPIDERRIGEYRQQELQMTCEKGLYAFAKEVVTDPNTQNMILGMWTAKRLLDIASAGRSLAALAPAKQAVLGVIGRVGTQVGKFIFRGPLKPVLGFAIWKGGAYTTLFITIGLAVSYGIIGPLRKELEVKNPIRRHKKNLIELAQEWRRQNWDAEGICRRNWFFDGAWSGTWSQLTAGFKKDLDLKYCNEHLMSEFLDSHFGVLDGWRKQLLKPTRDSVYAWVKHTAQTLNTYHASKLFYRDIITQIKLQREGQWTKDFQIPRREVPGKPGYVQDDGIGSFVTMTQQLPLFRSSPFYGWHMNVEFERKPRRGYEFGGSEWSLEQVENGDYNTELVDPHSHKIMKWDEWMKSEPVLRPLVDRWMKFQEDHLPAIDLFMDQLLEDLKEEDYRPMLETIKANLNSGTYEGIVYGLQLISYQSELERTTNYCRKSLRPIDPETRERKMERIAKKRAAWCPMTTLQKQFLDRRLFKWNEEEDRFLFRGKVSNRAMGYNSNMGIDLNGEDLSSNSGVDPFGMKPLSVGQQYLIEYEARFERAEVDPDFYDMYFDGMSQETMTEYLLKQMVCGVKPDVTTRNLERKVLRERSRLTSPSFRPPALALRKDLRICAGVGSKIATNILPGRSGGIGKVMGSRGWKTSSDFYHSIVDKRGPEFGAYAGIVDLLYNELDLNSIGGFENWWDTHIKPQFEMVMSEKVKLFQDHVIGKKLKSALERPSPDDHLVKRGVLDSLTDHYNAYFVNFLDPMARELELDKRFVGGDETSGSVARAQFLEQYGKTKAQLGEVFAFIKGQKSEFTDTELEEKFQKRLNEVMQEDTKIQFSQDLTSQDEIQILVAYEMALLIINDLKVLFKANDSESYAFVLEFMRANIEENVELDEETKAALDSELLDLEMQILDDFETDAYRVGKVILTHKNISEREGLYIYPRADVLKVLFTGMELLFIEVFDVLKLRSDFRSLEDIDTGY